MEAELGVICTCDPGPEGQHRYWCGPDNPHAEPDLDLAVKFREPTVGGLTGKQLSLLRYLEEQQRQEAQCAFIFFPADARGPEERCDWEPADGSRFCEDHVPEQDDYDCYIDRNNE